MTVFYKTLDKEYMRKIQKRKKGNEGKFKICCNGPEN